MWNDNDMISAICDNLQQGENRFPCNCPVCNNHTAHIYMHRHNDKHCGIWTWCSTCNAYSHMSGEVPSWWNNPSFVDDSKLCAEPDYLDTMASDIDEWINSIPDKSGAPDKSFVMEDKFKVKFIKDFQGIPSGTIGMLVIKNDFKSITMEFINTEGTAVNLDINPREVSSVFEIIE